MTHSQQMHNFRTARRDLSTPADAALDGAVRAMLPALGITDAEYRAAKDRDRAKRDREIADEEWIDERLAEAEAKENDDAE